MLNAITDTIKYVPKINPEIFIQALYGSNLIKSRHIRTIEGVVQGMTFNKIALTNSILQGSRRNCGWSPDQIMQLSDKEVTVKNYKINLQQCISEIEATLSMLDPNRIGANNYILNDDIRISSLGLIVEETSKEVEYKIFKGDNSANNLDFDGAYTILKNSTESIKVKGVDITEKNIQGEIKKVYMAIPEDVLMRGLENSGLRIFLSRLDMTKLLMSFTSTFNGNVVIDTNFTKEGEVIKYLGIELVPTIGLSSGEMICAEWINFIFCTDLLSDTEYLETGYLPFPQNDIVAIKAEMRMSFVIPFENEGIIYSSEVEDNIADQPEPLYKNPTTEKSDVNPYDPPVNGVQAISTQSVETPATKSIDTKTTKS